MVLRSTILNVSLVFLLAACSAPIVDQPSSSFNEAKFSSDLSKCRGGTFFEATAKTFGIALLGSGWGGIQGASAGAISGNGWEGAAIGAALGGTIGIGAGAAEAIEEHEAKIDGCLREKGYSISG